MGTDTWLLATVAFTLVLWVPYVLDRTAVIGLQRTLGNPRPHDVEELHPWAQRAKRAHDNAVENLVLFVPLALLAIGSGVGDGELASAASATYFGARVVHTLVYIAGIPVIRTLAFFVGWCAQVALVWVLFQAAV